MLTTLKIIITGIVQGVGFRPYVYQCASRYQIKGLVFNDNRGVEICAQHSSAEHIDQFIEAIQSTCPPLAKIEALTATVVEQSTVFNEFSIVRSSSSGERSHVIPPDACVCDACLTELFDQNDRRYQYPFINCTHCGPRYSIVTDIPYDRPSTTMHKFKMCDECQHEYDNPNDRRFHAQPIACRQCGPKITIKNQQLQDVTSENIIATIVKLLKAGHILAVKGIGGYHLMVDSCHDGAVALLRKRKNRPVKPFCLLFESIEQCSKYSVLTEEDKRVLMLPERPITLVTKKKQTGLSEQIAPYNKEYGVMIAYTPLHHLILKGNFNSLVCTSANFSGSPIIYEEDYKQLFKVADYVVSNDREIHTFSDDSVVRVIQNNEQKQVQIIRRSRGYVPRVNKVKEKHLEVLAVGAEFKNTVSMLSKGNLLVSQYLGDLLNISTYQAFQKTIDHLQGLYGFRPQVIACDMHPNFMSSEYAKQSVLPVIQVQHHHAHMCACMIEHQIPNNIEVLGIIFDGMGYGTDHNIWGGEFLVGNYSHFIRAGHFQYFPIPGGDLAQKNINLVAFSCLYSAYQDINKVMENWSGSMSEQQMMLYKKMIDKQINAPLTSSVGRIFDAVSALSGVCNNASYEGQAAIMLEQAIKFSQYDVQKRYPYTIDKSNEKLTILMNEVYLAIIKDKQQKLEPEIIAWKFHNTLINIILEVSLYIRETKNINVIVLSGGCFQNKFLLQAAIEILTGYDFNVIIPKLYPSNDGAISLGQAAHVIHGYEVYKENGKVKGEAIWPGQSNMHIPT